MKTNTTEKDFQNQIIEHLANTGYSTRNTKQYDKTTCLDVELVLNFIKATQPKLWKRFEDLYKTQAEQKFLHRLVNELNTKGTIEILRNGFKDVGCHFKLFFPRPNNNKNLDLFDKFEANVFSVIDELEYEKKEMGNRVDLALFINGIPVISIELKDTFSQGVENAMKQYRETRDPKELFFQRCIVHFAMSDEKIYMSTKLKGEQTRFLPFNKRFENPEVKNDFKTSYLYKDILQKNKFSKLISNFIYFEKDKKTGKGVNIFPRFHQLDCVNNILNDVEVKKNYLIQHSAGSGKTKTIAWLAHGLINKFDDNDERIFDIVIVVSDRKVIDRQLQEQVKAIEKVKGIVEKIDKNSEQLKEALISGSNIIVTTIQKFPFILDEMQEAPNRKYAVIIDEAHSSQTGSTARKMKQALAVDSLEEAERIDEEEMDKLDEELFKEMEQSKNLSNTSFFAFTATPKNKTLELFGTEDENGKFHPFHLYTMSQAIKEGFILDVLENYLTYETYFKLYKKADDDPKYAEKKAMRLLRNYIERHPNTIDKKTDIMLNHFMSSTIHKIRGKAKAMVVTKSRLHAVLYKRAFDKFIKREGYNIKTLVAFTGIIEHDEQEYTENSMNNLGKKKIQEAFQEDKYKILIVANKFQTGFDEPQLHTMYVDKMLNGVTAVQTLSRANRIIPGVKNDTLVLDFVNDVAVIQKAFQPYYDETYLKEKTDPHKLYELFDKLSAYLIFDENEVESFVKNRQKGANQAVLHGILNPIVAEFKKRDKKVQVEFKKTLKRYQSIYSFLSQLIPFSDLSLEKMFIFNKFLLKKLPTINDPLPYSVLEDADIDSYKLKENEKVSIKLNADGELVPLSSVAAGFQEEIEEKVSMIIKKLNDAFGTDFSEDDRVFISRMLDTLSKNEELINKIKAENDKSSIKAVFGKFFDSVMSEILSKNMDFYKKIVDNEKLKNNLEDGLFEMVYSEHSKKSKSKKASKLKNK